MIAENMLKATHSAGFLVGELREAHRAAINSGKNVLEHVLLEKIQQAAEMENELKSLLAAVKLDAYNA